MDMVRDQAASKAAGSERRRYSTTAGGSAVVVPPSRSGASGSGGSHWATNATIQCPRDSGPGESGEPGAWAIQDRARQANATGPSACPRGAPGVPEGPAPTSSLELPQASTAAPLTRQLSMRFCGMRFARAAVASCTLTR